MLSDHIFCKVYFWITLGSISHPTPWIFTWDIELEEEKTMFCYPAEVQGLLLQWDIAVFILYRFVTNDHKHRSLTLHSLPHFLLVRSLGLIWLESLLRVSWRWNQSICSHLVLGGSFSNIINFFVLIRLRSYFPCWLSLAPRGHFTFKSETEHYFLHASNLWFPLLWPEKTFCC